MTSSIENLEFVSTDYQLILSETVAAFELESGAAVPPASMLAILLRIGAYREKLLRVLINETGKLCLLAGARSNALDFLGELVGCARLASEPASCDLSFVWASPLAVALEIPAGFRVQSGDGLVIFATTTDTTVSAGARGVTVSAECLTSGTAGNDYAAGTVNVLIDTLPITPQSVGNDAATAGGADTESDDHYRERIRLSAEASHGTAAAYKRLALDASTEVVDVAVLNIGPGEVGVYVIGADGAAVSSGGRSAVTTAVTADENRTLCDTVTVANATPVAFAVDVEIEFLEGKSALAGTSLDEAERLIAEWADVLKVTIGKDIVPEEIIALCQGLPGVYRVNVITPAYTVVAGSEVAQYTSISVTNAGETEA